MSWTQIMQQGGSPGNKVGLAWTPYDDSRLHGVTRPKTVSQDVSIGGLRMSQGGRLFGFYTSGIFHILWFDPTHKIVPYKKQKR